MVTVKEALANKFVREIHSRPLPRRYYLPDHTPTLDHVRSAFGQATLKASAHDLECLREAIEHQKGMALGWGKDEVAFQIVENFNALQKEDSVGGWKLDLGLTVNGWSQLRTVWTEDGGKVMNRLMWESCFGCFDRDPGWARRMEERYLKKNGWTMDHDGPADKKSNRRSVGCFESTFNRCKTERIKRLRDAARKTHKGEIKIKRSADEITDEDRYKKRPKGKTLGAYGSVGGIRQYDTAIDGNENDEGMSDVDLDLTSLTATEECTVSPPAEGLRRSPRKNANAAKAPPSPTKEKQEAASKDAAHNTVSCHSCVIVQQECRSNHVVL